jgi:multiple sugar transport system substrate-binding protein
MTRRPSLGAVSTTAAATTLRGMAWEHDRGVRPLIAATREWRTTHPTADISWNARPLKDFEDQPLEQLAERYDLVLIDHPFTQTAAESGLITAVDDWADATYLADQRDNSVGPSFSSYSWNDQQWALAIDAACQVSAVREDMWDAAGLGTLPSTWDDVADLTDELAARRQVAIPLNPNHAYCVFLALGSALGGNGFWPTGRRIDDDVAADALARLKEISGALHPESGRMDPIAASERMASTDEIVYVPLMFGYSNYARKGYRTFRLRFGNAPARGSVLGGVGIAVSERSEHQQLAADFARFVASAGVQSSTYLHAGGQPGHGHAWASHEGDDVVGGFFTGTIDTMCQAVMRPRVSGHRRFQELAGELIHAFLWTEQFGIRQCIERYQDLTTALLGAEHTGGATHDNTEVV